MTKAEIVSSMSRTFHKVGFKLKKHSPEILVATGVVGTVVSAVMACKATTKVSTILDDAKHDVEGIHSVLETPALQEKYIEKHGVEYTKEDSKKDLTIVYAQTGLKLAKLYAPAVLLGAASLGCILTSHNIIRKRNIALAAAYATVDGSFKDYRKRVIERFGKELDKELKYDIKVKEIEETVTDENGEEKVVKKNVEVMDPNLYSKYARFFDDGCTGWDPDPEYSLMFLKAQQAVANEKLKARGVLFLNEVYEMLGIPRSTAGQVVGWVYNEKNPVGDNFVDFGIYDMYNPNVRRFVNGDEKVILLDFNVDGVVYDLLG